MPNQFLSPEGDLENYFVSEYFLIDQWVGDTLWTWGRNYGSLGNGVTTGSISTPITTFAGGANWKQVSSGAFTGAAAAIKTDGTLWTWGSGSSGGLGNGVTTGSISTPITTFAGGTNWRQVSSPPSNTYMAAIKTDGTLWTWGFGFFGLLGNNVSGDRSTPITTFAGGTNWKQVACGGEGSAAVKTDGTLWTWGKPSNGLLGNGRTAFSPQAMTPITTFAGGTNWKQVSCGSSHMAAVKTDGTLWVWGAAGYGKLGNGVTTGTISTPVTTFAGGTNWKQVDCRSSIHMAAIKTDGTLWTWGNGTNGCLGNAVITGNISTPVTTFAGGTNWKQVAGGSVCTLAIKTDGTLWTWGYGGNGRLGNAVTAGNISTPVTTFAGGTNWKQVSGGNALTAALTYIDPVL